MAHTRKLIFCISIVVMVVASSAGFAQSRDATNLRSSKTTRFELTTQLNKTLEQEIGETLYEKGLRVTEVKEMARTTDITTIKLPSGHFLKVPAGTDLKLSYTAEKFEPTVCFIATEDDTKDSVSADISEIIPSQNTSSQKSTASKLLTGGLFGLLLTPANVNPIVCLVDRTNAGKFDSTISTAIVNNLALSTMIAYTVTSKNEIQNEVKGGFRQDFLYQGLANRVARFSYREFYDGVSRPSFTQDLTYEIDPDGTAEIGFRGLRINVLGITNRSIRYTVTKEIK